MFIGVENKALCCCAAAKSNAETENKPPKKYVYLKGL